MDRARNHVIQLVDPEKAKELPQHDFADSRLFVTPSAHRVIQKIKTDVNGKSILKSVEDQTFVYYRPKIEIGSTSSTWISEQMDMRCIETIS